MHTDENKKFDKRNIESNLRKGTVTLKEYEAYLSRLPDAGTKAIHPDEDASEDEEEGTGGRGGHGGTSKKGAISPPRRG